MNLLGWVFSHREESPEYVLDAANKRFMVLTKGPGGVRVLGLLDERDLITEIWAQKPTGELARVELAIKPEAGRA